MDFLKEIFRFFIAKDYSFASKFIGFIIVLIAIFLIDNLLGFSFYYSNNQKINQIRSIEELKTECANETIIYTINEVENEIINRKNVIEIFLNLFSKDAIDKKSDNLLSKSDTIYIVVHDTIKQIEKHTYIPFGYSQLDTSNLDSNFVELTSIKSVYFKKSLLYDDSIGTKELVSECKKTQYASKSRSQIWHTISSSYALIILFILFPIIPFVQKEFSWSIMIGMLFFMIVTAGFIWLNQYLFGLIPVILNRPWINYLFNFSVETIIILIVGLISKNKYKV